MRRFTPEFGSALLALLLAGAVLVVVTRGGKPPVIGSNRQAETPRAEQRQAEIAPPPSQRVPSGSPEPTATDRIIRLPPGIPTPHHFASEAEVAEYVHVLIGPEIEWSDVHVALTKQRYVNELIIGAKYNTPAPGSTPDESQYDLDYHVWIVGYASDDVVSPYDLLGFGALEGSDSPWNHGHEAYIVIDEIGNPSMAGLLDQIDTQGTLTHIASWSLADIDSLPSP